MGKREEILRAAAEEFAAKGYRATTFSSIGERVGMHRNALQHYIASKPALAVDVVTVSFGTGRFLSQDEPLPTGGIPTVLHMAQRIAERYVTDVFPRAALRLQEEQAYIPVKLPVALDGWIAPLTALLGEARDNGELAADTDLDDLAWRVVAAFAGTRMLAEALGEVGTLPQRVLRTTEDLLSAHASRRPHVPSCERPQINAR